MRKLFSLQTQALRSGRRRNCSNSLKCQGWVQTHSCDSSDLSKHSAERGLARSLPFSWSLHWHTGCHSIAPSNRYLHASGLQCPSGSPSTPPHTKPHNLQLQLQLHIGQGFPEASSEALNTSSQGFCLLSMMEKRALS